MSSARGAEPAKEGRRHPVIRLPVSVFVLDHVAGRGQVGDDGVGAALGDPHRHGDVAQAGPGSWAIQTRARAWLVRKLHSFITRHLSKKIPEINC